MSRSVGTRMRLVMALAAMAAMMFALMPAAPASAGGLTVAVQGTATLNNGTLACGSGTFTGTATGVHGTTPIVAGAVSASFNYCNDLVEGTADGTITIAGHSCGFSWRRTGTAAAITFSGGCSGSANAHLTVTSAPGAIPGTAEVTAQGSTTH